MLGEVAQRLEAQPVGHLGPHGQRVGVGEAERLADRQPPGLEPCADLLWCPERGVLQDDEAECSRVLRIEVDRPRLDGPIREAGAAEADPPLDAGFAHLLDHLSRRLRQDVALGEGLRAHSDAALGGGGGGGVQQQHPERRATQQAPDPPRLAGAPAASVWAVRNWVTNGVAGRSTRSANVPRCTTLPAVSRVMVAARTAASRMSWVTRTTVFPSSANRRPRWPCSSARTTGSRAASGSSRRGLGGSGMRGRLSPPPPRRPPGSPPG